MAQTEDLAQAAARLEAALERIAHATSGGLAEAGNGSGVAPGEIASRLDALIAQLRRALNE